MVRRDGGPSLTEGRGPDLHPAEIARLNLSVERAVRAWLDADGARRASEQAQEVVRALRELRAARSSFPTAA